MNFRVKWLGGLRLMARCLVCVLVLAMFTSCQSNRDSQPITNKPPVPLVTLIPTPPNFPRQNSEARNEFLKIDQIRNVCINGRRRLCGLVLQVEDGGLVVDSGYTDLLRPELLHSWVVPAGVDAHRTANLVEEISPGSVCVGLAYVTALPKRPTVRQYDYIVLQAYPAGEYTYAPVQNVKRKIRKFSVELETAIRLNLLNTER